MTPDNVHNQPSVVNDDQNRNTIFANSIKVEDFDIDADKGVLRDSLSHVEKSAKRTASLDLKQYLDKLKTQTLATTLSPEDMRNSIQLDKKTPEQKRSFCREEDQVITGQSRTGNQLRTLSAALPSRTQSTHWRSYSKKVTTRQGASDGTCLSNNLRLIINQSLVQMQSKKGRKRNIGLAQTLQSSPVSPVCAVQNATLNRKVALGNMARDFANQKIGSNLIQAFDAAAAKTPTVSKGLKPFFMNHKSKINNFTDLHQQHINLPAGPMLLDLAASEGLRQLQGGRAPRKKIHTDPSAMAAVHSERVSLKRETSPFKKPSELGR